MAIGSQTERLIIENFAGITRLEMEVKPFTVLIGPQSVGKSVTAKAVYFFKSLPWTLYKAASRDMVPECHYAVLQEFQELFPPETFGEGLPTLTWIGPSGSTIKINGVAATIPESLTQAYEQLVRKEETNSDKFEVNDGILFSQRRWKVERAYWKVAEEIFLKDRHGGHGAFFIPAGRSFYVQIERDAASFFTSAQVDPFVRSFGKLLAQLKNPNLSSHSNGDAGTAADLVFQLLGGTYTRENNEDVITTEDGRRLRSIAWSSGQQEAHPLALILQYLCNRVLAPNDLFIEEPEAHLFPTSQKIMTELIALAFNAGTPGVTMFLTTHSPYILTTINNLLQAGSLYTGPLGYEEKAALAKILPPSRALAREMVGVYYMDRESCRSIMDEETGLIGTSEIDKASWDINEEFEALLGAQRS